MLLGVPAHTLKQAAQIRNLATMGHIVPDHLSECRRNGIVNLMKNRSQTPSS